ncbi:MAG: RAD55 family ATPase [Candidatus Syntropharchaeia archaeon]
MEKIPTGIPSLDPILKGGIPAGSFVLLLGETGAGHIEFAYTSALILSRMRSFPPPGVTIPEKICYLTITKSGEDIINEMRLSFPDLFHDGIVGYIKFKDFSDIYFRNSPLPLCWICDAADVFSSFEKKEEDLLKALISYLCENAENSLIIIDSLTTILRYYAHSMNRNIVVASLRGIQRMAKRWNGMVYGLLTANIFRVSDQEEISDCVDGVFVFEWEEIGTTQRQRSMYVKKFTGLMPQLEQDNIAKFETRIVPSGFEVSNIKQILGRG